MMNKKLLYICVLLLALLGSKPLAAQHYIGARAGLGVGNCNLYPYQDTHYLWGLANGGLVWKYYSHEKYVGGVEIDIEFMQKGYQVEEDYWVNLNVKDTTSVYTRRVNTIQIPIFWQPNFLFFKEHLRVFINLGVVLSYNFDSSYSWSSEDYDIDESGYYDMITVRDNRWGYGLAGGLGFNYRIKNRYEISVEGRYYYGYSDILKSTSKYEDNPRRSPLDNINVSIGFNYRLGK